MLCWFRNPIQVSKTCVLGRVQTSSGVWWEFITTLDLVCQDLSRWSFLSTLGNSILGKFRVCYTTRKCLDDNDFCFHGQKAPVLVLTVTRTAVHFSARKFFETSYNFTHLQICSKHLFSLKSKFYDTQTILHHINIWGPKWVDFASKKLKNTQRQKKKCWKQQTFCVNSLKREKKTLIFARRTFLQLRDVQATLAVSVCLSLTKIRSHSAKNGSCCLEFVQILKSYNSFVFRPNATTQARDFPFF